MSKRRWGVIKRREMHGRGDIGVKDRGVENER